MSKELEAFRDILGILSAVSGCEVDMDSEYIKIVEQALQRLEAIDNANPSEALKALDRNIVIIREKDYTIIEQALLKAQEQEKENQELKDTNMKYAKLIENLLEKYEIEDLSELEIALDYYYHRYDNVQTRRVEKNENI